ncbi:MAG: glycosyltransferase family 4 protein [Micrococcales bacterium]|nr:glycosyltransferase family 4 protein [Micrococcales bacterium]
MRVALLSDCYLPRLGGIEVQVHDLAAHLSRSGHQVEIFTATNGADGEQFGDIEEVDGIPVHRMSLPLPFGVPVNPLAPPQVKRRLEKRGFDVAHVHMGVVSPFATDMAKVTLELGLPTAITWHCVIGRSEPLLRRIGHARDWAAQGAALSAVSAMAARHLQPVAGAAADIQVLPNGIDAARWARPQGRPRRPGDTLRVVTAMRLATRKRPKAVVEILRRTRELVPGDIGLELELFGEGPERRRVQRYLDRHHMDWVSLPGRVSRDELCRRYWDADAYLSPTRLEAFGLAALEARTAGLPVVAAAGSGVEDFVVDGESGLLAADDEGMARALARLATEPALREAISRHNADVRPAQEWPQVVTRVEDEYRRAMRLRIERIS